MKNIVISGSSGFVGNNLIKFYKQKKSRLTCLSSQKINIKKTKNLSWITLNKDYSDLKNQVINFDIIYFCTGIGTISKSSIYDENKRENKIFKNLIRLIKKNSRPCKIIFLSSYSVYGNTKKKAKETDVCKPLSQYAKNKIIYEKELKVLSKLSRVKVIILRLSSLYGPYLKKQVMWDTLSKIKNKNNLNVSGTGNEQRDFLYIDDAVKALNLVASKKNLEDFTIFNCGVGKSIKIRYLLNLILKITKIKKKLYFNNLSSLENPNSLKVDIDKLKKIGWKCNTEIYLGLNKYLKWFKKK